MRRATPRRSGEEGSAESWVAAVRSIRTPVIVHGVDLGPALVGRVSELAARWMPSKIRAVTSIRALLRRLRPAGVLLADEYHRQDWLTAARAEGVPIAAIQHGMIYRGHNGYIHRERPDSLALPDRTYVFGEWERDVLVQASVYRDDEVRVSGSPRLDLAEAAPDADAAALRAELGVRPGRPAGRAVRDLRAGVSAVPHPVRARSTAGPAVAQCPPGREAASRREGPWPVRGGRRGSGRRPRVRAAARERRPAHRPVPPAAGRGRPPRHPLHGPHGGGRGRHAQPARRHARVVRPAGLRRGGRGHAGPQRRGLPRGPGCARRHHAAGPQRVPGPSLPRRPASERLRDDLLEWLA